jgi:hypothetical protein
MTIPIFVATKDANKYYFDGEKTYKIVLPSGIPEKNLKCTIDGKGYDLFKKILVSTKNYRF